MGVDPARSDIRGESGQIENTQRQLRQNQLSKEVLHVVGIVVMRTERRGWPICAAGPNAFEC